MNGNQPQSDPSNVLRVIEGIGGLKAYIRQGGTMNLTIKPTLKIKTTPDGKKCMEGETYMHDCPYLNDKYRSLEYECVIFGFLSGLGPNRHKDCIRAEKNGKTNK